ncbi:alpha/beta hydrolase [Ruminococcaceae bacterium OttesenSCG-928-L11]|nr:alpha/beta hydrolase [Ruminococcaceae bacterium OttesenSCG-928-L11]
MRRIYVDTTTRCAVEDINPTGRKVVLFVHGWPLNRHIFENQYEVLPNYGIRCISYDIRGFGDSDRPWQGYSYDRLADDLCKVIQSIDAKSIVLCGFSMGGAVCVRYMDKYRGQKVSKLMLMGAACPSFVQRPGYNIGMTREQVDALIAQTYQDRALMCDSFGRMCFASNPSEPYLRMFSGYGTAAAGYATIRCLESLRDEDLRASMGKIRVPTAILHGTQDRICPFPMAEEMHRGIPDSFVIPFERSGHCLFYDEKDKCNSSMVDFINASV